MPDPTPDKRQPGPLDELLEAARVLCGDLGCEEDEDSGEPCGQCQPCRLAAALREVEAWWPAHEGTVEATAANEEDAG